MKDSFIENNPEITEAKRIISKSYRNYIKYIFIFSGVLFLIAFLVGGFVLGNYQSKKIVLSKITPTLSPSPTLVSDFKIYKNTKYGFELKYPPKGITQKGEKFLEIECGNAIKENVDNIFVDNLFKIQIVDWNRTLDDYLIAKGAKNIYEFKPILNSGAEEAVEVVGIKKGLEVVSVGYPPLMYISYIYKNDNKIFLIVHEAHPPNQTIEGGCINPEDLDTIKYSKYANQNWNISDSFKFTPKLTVTPPAF